MLAEFGLSIGGKTWHAELFTANGTWTKNNAAGDLILVEAVGGGQAGANGTGVGSGGAGGNSAQRAMAWLNVNGVTTVTVTIGTAGASNGAHGGDTTFGTMLRAMGSGLTTPSLRTYSGTAGPWQTEQLEEQRTGNAMNTPGTVSSQHPAFVGTAAASGATVGGGPGGGAGAGTRWSGGGAGGAGVASGTAAAGSAATGYGGGGGGGGGSASGTGGLGGAGAPGMVRVWSYW